MSRYALDDATYARLSPHLPGKAGDRGRTAADNRRFLDAVVFIARNGGPWRDLPEHFGRWNSIYRRFDRWSRAGVWHRLFEHLQDPDLDWLLLDSTSIRAHQHAAGARKRGIRRKRSPSGSASGAVVVG